MLHLAAGNLFGGVETYLLTLARLRHLCPEMEPSFGVCFPGRLRDELVATGVPVHEMGSVRFSRPWTLLRARWRVKKIIRANAISIVATHGTWPHAVFAPGVRRAGAGLVNFAHGEMTGGHRIDRRASRRPPDAVIANSRFVAETVGRVFPGMTGRVCYPPVESNLRCDASAARERIRAEFATPNEAVVILIVSRIEELKGHRVLLEALARLKELAGWVCWVVGGAQRPHEKDLLNELQTRAGQLGVAARLRFVGPRGDVPIVMAAADILCQPNTGPEGFGLAFIEALRASLPVVTSAIGGAREIVTPECGVLCPPGDASAVASTLHALLTEMPLRQKLSEGGPARAAELCDPARQLSILESSLATVPRPELQMDGSIGDLGR